VFFAGMIVMVYNVWKTVAGAEARPVPVVKPAHA